MWIRKNQARFRLTTHDSEFCFRRDYRRDFRSDPSFECLQLQSVATRLLFLFLKIQFGLRLKVQVINNKTHKIYSVTDLENRTKT